MTWYAYYGCILLFFVLYIYLGFFLGLQRVIISTMVSQWYFTKTRMWLSGTLCKALKIVRYHMGSLLYHSFIINLIAPIRDFSGFFKRRIDKIVYANGCQMCWIRSCKCIITNYERRLKYIFSEALNQV